MKSRRGDEPPTAIKKGMNMSKLQEDINVVNLEKVSTVLNIAEDLIKEIQNTKKYIEENLCLEHEEFKQDLFGDASLQCESCFEQAFHANEFSGVAEEDRGDV